MRIYETTFIVNPQMEEATIDRQVKAIAEIITQNGGKIIQENHLGTRRLAYEIMGLTQGFYGGFIFESANEALTPLDRHYKLNEEYLRHLTVRFEGDEAALWPEKASEPTAAAAPKPATPKPTAAAAPEPTTPATPEPTTPVTPEPATESVEPEGQVEQAAAETAKPTPETEEPTPEAEAETRPEPPAAPEPEPTESASDDTEEML